MSPATAKKLIQFITGSLERESAFLYPEGMRNVFMNDPYGLLDLIRDEAKLTPEQIDAWMVEAQGGAPAEEVKEATPKVWVVTEQFLGNTRVSAFSSEAAADRYARESSLKNDRAIYDVELCEVDKEI